jgi:hypothetical protein
MSVSNDATNRIPISHRKLRLLTVRIVMNPIRCGGMIGSGAADFLVGLGHNSASVTEAFSFQAATSQTPAPCRPRHTSDSGCSWRRC